MSFAAKYPGRCNACDERIEIDDMCAFEDDLIVHADCEEDEPKPPADPCPACWIVPANNGECGCT